MVSYFSHEMSWMRSGTELSQFLRIFLPTLEAISEDYWLRTNVGRYKYRIPCFFFFFFFVYQVDRARPETV